MRAASLEMASGSIGVAGCEKTKTSQLTRGQPLLQHDARARRTAARSAPAPLTAAVSSHASPHLRARSRCRPVAMSDLRGMAFLCCLQTLGSLS